MRPNGGGGLGGGGLQTVERGRLLPGDKWAAAGLGVKRAHAGSSALSVPSAAPVPCHECPCNDAPPPSHVGLEPGSSLQVAETSGSLLGRSPFSDIFSLEHHPSPLPPHTPPSLKPLLPLNPSSSLSALLNPHTYLPLLLTPPLPSLLTSLPHPLPPAPPGLAPPPLRRAVVPPTSRQPSAATTISASSSARCVPQQSHTTQRKFHPHSPSLLIAS